MIWWLFLLAPELPNRPDLYPPDGCILLQRSGRVTLRWKLPGRKFEVRLWNDDALVAQVKTTDASFPVTVTSGGRYRWTVTPMDGKPRRHAFSVADQFSYHCDGRTGGLGRKGRDHAPDPGGGSGKVITHNAPWREYLDIDVRAGQPGQGGPGGWFYNQQHGLTQAMNGDNGRSGRGGRVETHLEP